MKKILLAVLLLSLFFSLFGCDGIPAASDGCGNFVTEPSDDISDIITEETAQYAIVTTVTAPAEESEADPETAAEETDTAGISIAAPDISPYDIPEYSGSAYAEINGNVPFFTEYPDQTFELYSPLDGLGRCGTAYACISVELMPTEERGEIGAIKPSGWQTVRYDGLIEDRYLYNRCHLIGFQLAGDNANECNLITGTRYMNVTGMQPFENKLANYVKANNAHVLYRVTPMFNGDDLVAYGVLMEAYSLDDEGAGIQFCVFCSNVQPGIVINYADGSSCAAETETPAEESSEAEQITEQGSQKEITYVLNDNSKKFHRPDCSSVKDIKDKNRIDFYGTREEAIEMGYVPCKACDP